MCGRFDLSTDPEALTDWFGVQWRDLPYKERYNVAPTDPILVLGSDGDVTHADYMRWGLIPYWKKPDQKLPLNITRALRRWPQLGASSGRSGTAGA